MIAALYARYSSDSQRAESIVAQLRVSRDYCKRKGYTIIKEYADEAMTGTNDQRPQYQQMLTDAESGMFEVVVFHKVDRSARNEFDYYTNKHRLAVAGVSVEYSGQTFGDTPEGQFSEALIVGMSAYYSRNLSREVKKGLKENVLAGKLTGGKPAFGFDIDSQKRYVINEGEAIAVRQIFKMYADGHGYADILNWLSAHGYCTRRRQPFGKNSLHDLLKNRRYIGTCILGKNAMRPDGTRNAHREDHDGMTIVPNACPAIVSQELWQAVHDKLESNRHRGGRYRAHNTYLLSGLVTCGECGHKMVGASHAARNGAPAYHYYRCATNDMKGARRCPMHAIDSTSLDGFLVDYLIGYLSQPEKLERIAERMMEHLQNESSTGAADLERLQAGEKKAMTALDKMYDAIEAGGAFDDFDRIRMKKVKAEILQYRSQISELEQQAPPAAIDKTQIKRFLMGFLNRLTSGRSEDVSSMLQHFVKDVTVHKDCVDAVLRVPSLAGTPPSAPMKVNLEIRKTWSRDEIKKR